ncbi:MAG TPA: ABC transporter permease [Candidatus Limnocylindria bacterium]|nr:ABC transporter permease [Candidatus Limnocylindria bacterium]
MSSSEGATRPRPAGAPSPLRSLARSIGIGLLFLVLLLGVWEGAKALGGDPWRFEDANGAETVYRPPFKWAFVNDLKLPHVWDIAGALAAPVQRQQQETLGAYLVGAALYTAREAALGFVFGGILGLAIAAVFVHSKLAERAFMPYVVASQTIPILALAPLIAFAFGNGVLGIVIVASYLTFFPVAIAELRGLSSPDPRALELMRSCAASRWTIFWKLRMPASLPYLFAALKIAATASIVGAIVGEGNPGGSRFGLGRSILNFNEQYTSAPEKLWAAILVASLLGLSFFLVVRAAELIVLRGRPQSVAG